MGESSTAAPARCRQCGQRIVFRQTASGRYQPIAPDTQEVHFATCPQRRRLEVPGTECHRCHSTNVEQGPGTATHHASLRCRDCGQFRWLPKPRDEVTGT